MNVVLRSTAVGWMKGVRRRILDRRNVKKIVKAENGFLLFLLFNATGPRMVGPWTVNH